MEYGCSTSTEYIYSVARAYRQSGCIHYFKIIIIYDVRARLMNKHFREGRCLVLISSLSFKYMMSIEI